MKFHLVARLEEIPAGSCRAIEIGKEKIALCNVDGTIYAIGDECSHADALLSQGHLEGTTIVCPWHSATFDVRTGEKLTGPAPFEVPRYRVEVRGEEVWVATRK